MKKIMSFLLFVGVVIGNTSIARSYDCDLGLTNASTYGIYGTHFHSVHSDISSLYAISNYRSAAGKYYNITCHGTGPTVDRLNQGVSCTFYRRVVATNPNSNLAPVAESFAQDEGDKFSLTFNSTKDSSVAKITCIAID